MHTAIKRQNVPEMLALIVSSRLKMEFDINFTL